MIENAISAIKDENVSLIESVLFVVFFGLIAAVFAPNTSLTLYGHAAADYAVWGAPAALLGAFVTNESFSADNATDKLSEAELAAVAIAAIAPLSTQYIPQIHDLLMSSEYTQLGTVAVSSLGYLYVAFK